MPDLTLNGEPMRCDAGTTLAELIARRGEDPRTLATAVNGEFVPRAARAETPLHDGDELTFFKAIVGG